MVYNTWTELEDFYHFYINNWDKAQEIIEAGYKHTIENHTFDVRAKQLVEIVEAA